MRKNKEDLEFDYFINRIMFNVHNNLEKARTKALARQKWLDKSAGLKRLNGYSFTTIK